MKYKMIFSVMVVIAILMAVSGCYKFSGENDNISVSDIFGEDEIDEDMKEITETLADESEENAEEDEESALAKILNKRAEEAEVEIKAEVIEEEKEEADDEEEKAVIPTKTVKEGEIVSFADLKATDADGDTITYTYSEPLDDSGEWQTEEGDAGEYIVTITASDGKSEVSQKIMIIVEALNNNPVFDVEDITVEEGDTVEIKPDVTDADNDPITIEYLGWMESDTYKTTYDDAGVYTVTVKVSDGKTTVSKDVIVTVNNKNRAPVMTEIKDIEAVEGEEIVISAKAVDPDGDTLTYTYSEPLDDSGVWQTGEGDEGEYMVTITASDGELKDSQGVLISIVSANKAPVLEVSDVTVNEGETVRLDVAAEDPDGDEVTITYSGWMTSDTKDTGYDDAGTYEVTVTASDGDKETSKTITVTVNNVNRAPSFGAGAFD